MGWDGIGYIDNTTQLTLPVCARLCAGGANLIFFSFFLGRYDMVGMVEREMGLEGERLRF
jgi:hypothetical protein